MALPYPGDLLNSGSITGAGGSAVAAGGAGGNGVYIEIVGYSAHNTAASLQVEPGAANTPGAPGEIFIDAQNVTGQFHP